MTKRLISSRAIQESVAYLSFLGEGKDAICGAVSLSECLLPRPNESVKLRSACTQ